MIPRLLRFGAALTVLGFLAACGGDDGDGGGGGGGDSVSASAYASSICTGVDTWFQAIQSQTEELSTATADLEGDLEGGKASIESYIDEVIAATDDLLAEVEEAGEPDVDDGAEVAAALEDGFEKVKQEFERAKDEIGAVGTDDPEEFVSEFQRIGGRLQDGSAMEDAFAGLEQFSDNEELDRAFDEEEACQALSG